MKRKRAHYWCFKKEHLNVLQKLNHVYSYYKCLNERIKYLNNYLVLTPI